MSLSLPSPLSSCPLSSYILVEIIIYIISLWITTYLHRFDGYMLLDAFMVFTCLIAHLLSSCRTSIVSYVWTNFYSSHHTFWLLLPRLCFYCLILTMPLGLHSLWESMAFMPSLDCGIQFFFTILSSGTWYLITSFDLVIQFFITHSYFGTWYSHYQLTSRFGILIGLSFGLLIHRYILYCSTSWGFSKK